MSKAGVNQMSELKKRKKRSLVKRFRRTAHGAKNAVKLIRGSRFTPPYEAPYQVVMRDKFLRLRRYTEIESGAAIHLNVPILLVPPLMVTSQVYDIAPALSAINVLRGAGFDVWLTDFGVPENELGGMDRTLDDHLSLIDAAIDFVREQTGSDVHLAGYSQGGMFTYQVTAYRKSRGVASITTFGSPVDLNKNVPGGMHRDLVDRLLNSARSALSWTLDDLKGVPGSFSSMGFKLVSPRQELRYLKMMLGILGDREALSKIEPTRRFLGGEGFIAWPGPAFRSFVDNIIVQNRMMTGGFVVNGRPVTLSDITVPILYFVGEKDDFARPPSVRAIQKVVSSTEVYEVSVQAGHFGLVVGSRSLREVWPTFINWLKWQSADGFRPGNLLNVNEQKGATPATSATTAESDFSGFVEELAEDMWDKLGEVSLDVSGALSFLRWQSPRLAKLIRLGLGARVNMSQRLEDQAREIPDQTFFLYRGRAYSYAEANIRVNQFVYSLLSVGISRGDYVGIMMDNHPDYLSLIVALNRMGAVAVLLNPGSQGSVLKQAIDAGSVTGIIADPGHLEAVLEVLPKDKAWMVYGDATQAAIPQGVACLEKLMDERIRECPLKSGANPGLADDVAMLVFTSGTTGLPKAARITNGRWMMAATGSAIAGALTPNDTVYCALPLYHATGLLLGAGGALVGGSRLALSPKFSVRGFWKDVKQCGATVVFYVGELCRYLISAPDSPSEKQHSVRLFFGNGMRGEVWEELVRRFGKVRVLEFYASTEGNVVLANLSGDKIGSVGRPPVISGPIELVKYDVENEDFLRDEMGMFIPCDDDEAGMLIGKITSLNPFSKFEGYTNKEASKKKILRGVFEPGDKWFVTGDILKRDEDGDYWFVDRVGDTFRWKGENISTEQVSNVVSQIPFVHLCAVYGVKLEGREGRAGMAALELAEGHSFDGESAYNFIQSELMPAGRPRFIRIVKALEVTSSLKVIKHQLQQEGIDTRYVRDSLYWYNEEKKTYTKLTKQNTAQAMALL